MTILLIGFAKSCDRLKLFYLYYHSVYYNQNWQGIDLPLETSTCKVTLLLRDVTSHDSFNMWSISNIIILLERTPDKFNMLFRTLVYWKPGTYSEHCQTPTMESFVKNSYLSCQKFSLIKFPKKYSLKKFLYFLKKNPALFGLSSQNVP